MKLANSDNPVRAGWLIEQSARLDAAPYLSGAYEARKLLERLPRTEPLQAVTRRGNGIFHAGRVSRRWVDNPEHGVPFFSSTDILEADYSFLPYIARSVVEENPRLTIERDWTLITRSGTVGRISYARADVDGYACSEHVLRVAPRREKILPGYLNAFLQSRYGIPIIASQASGSIIQHIEPSHIADLPVPRFDPEIEECIHELIQGAADLRTGFQESMRKATQDLFGSAGLSELADLRWSDKPRALGFPVNGVSAMSLRALNYDERAREIQDSIASVANVSLGEICEKGELERGNRFKRIEAGPGNGIPLVGQRQAFWMRPEERRIALKKSELKLVKVEDETILVAARGLLTEGALIGRATFISKNWQKTYGFSEDFLRVRSGDPEISGAYLFAYMRSDASFRVMRSLCAGTGPQDIHAILRRQVPIPLCARADRERIANTVRSAYRDRDEADRLEDEALRLLDEAVRDAAR
ncbi:restriction endonuclease subunit S [Streptomyces sp. NPDC007818]|uniref:methylation-associated defense system restriction endonuclease subunit S MAD5 n=1 Tax=Streptomyces sp. NPDC007818 TaxID=3364780 RepID=UPI00368CE2DF